VETTILIAENDSIISLDLKIFLKKHNFRNFLIATTIEDLICQYGCKNPDLIIIDSDLKSKFSNCSITQEVLENFKVPIIIISDFLKSELDLFFIPCKGYNILEKPINYLELLNFIDAKPI
jgi:DNA-binding response OmpR family regulator